MTNDFFQQKPRDYSPINTKYRSINSQIPVTDSNLIFEKLAKYEVRSMHGSLPVVWDRAEGFQVYDLWGNKWIDFTSTIFVANAGHANKRIMDSVNTQLNKPLVHCYNFATEIRANYLEYLINNTPDQYEKAYLVSTGSEATEAALKLMRMYSSQFNKKKLGIICFEGYYHGRTMGAQMMSHNPAAKEWIGYHDPNIYHLPFPYPWNINAVKNPKEFFIKSINDLIEKHSIDPLDDISGFMIETFQGWGSVFYPPEFVQEIEKFSKENNILVCYDEMQAGFGRTGKLFGYMHYNIQPDLLCCGKGISSGFPLGLVLGPNKVMEIPAVGSMSSTNSANPISCAAGLSSLKAIIEDGLLENSKILGNIFHEKLNEIMNNYPKQISHILGEGLVAAIHFNDEKGSPLIDLANEICFDCMSKGLLVVRTGRESIKLAPPLCINDEALIEGLEVLEEALSLNVNQKNE